MAAASAKAQSAAWTACPPAPASPPTGLERQLRLLIASGGDERLWLDPVTRRNRYGAPVGPAPDELWFSSSTACAASPLGWAAAGESLGRLIAPAGGLTIGGFFDDLRARLLALYGAPGCAAALCASGTEAEFLALLIAAGLARGRPVANIVVAPTETGAGVPAAAAGRHFLGRASLGGPVTRGEVLAGFDRAGVRLETIDIRGPDGRLRPPAEVDADAAERAAKAAQTGAFVLLHILDASKTGRPGLSRAAALDIVGRHPGQVLTVVDACQLRCPAEAVRADLAAGLAVMITGSKFAGGPPFCGALLIPADLAQALRRAPPAAEALDQYSARLDWPEGLRGRLSHPANLGLGLRWAAALAEIEAYEAIAPDRRAALLARFETAVRARIAATQGLAPLDPDAAPGAPGLVPVVQTSGADTRAVYQALQRPSDPATPICHLGQPVAAGPRAALRVCASMPMVTAAAAEGAAGLEADLDRLFDAWAGALATA